MHGGVAERVRPGLLKNELAAEIYRLALAGNEDENGYFGGDYPAVASLFPSGADASASHLVWDDRNLL